MTQFLSLCEARRAATWPFAVPIYFRAKTHSTSKAGGRQKVRQLPVLRQCVCVCVCVLPVHNDGQRATNIGTGHMKLTYAVCCSIHQHPATVDSTQFYWGIQTTRTHQYRHTQRCLPPTLTSPPRPPTTLTLSPQIYSRAPARHLSRGRDCGSEGI